MEENNTMPIVIVIQSMQNELTMLIDKYKAMLPPSIMESALNGTMADIRQLKANEISQAYAQLMTQKTAEKTEGEE